MRLPVACGEPHNAVSPDTAVVCAGFTVRSDSDGIPVHREQDHRFMVSGAGRRADPFPQGATGHRQAMRYSYFHPTLREPREAA